MTSKRQFDGERVKLPFANCVQLRAERPLPFEGTKCYASTSAIGLHGIDIGRLELVTYENRPSRANLTAKDGDVLFARMGATRKALLINGECSDFLFSTGFAVAKPLPGVVTSRCLLHLVRSEAFNTEKDKLCTGATQRAITNANLKKLKVLLPPYDQQDRLMDQLDCLAEQIELAERQIRGFDALVKSRFVEMFGGDLWPKKTIGEVAEDIRYGTSKKASESGSYAYLRMNNMTEDGRLVFGDVKRIDLEGAELEKCKVVKGDLLFNRTNSREKVGKTAVFHEDTPMVIAGYIIRVRFGSDVKSDYVSVYMNLPTTKAKLRSMAKGAVHQANINSKELSSIEIPVAPIELQDEFIDFVAKVDKPRFVAQQQIEKLQMLYDSLAQEYFG